MDILNWLYLRTSKLIRKTPNNPKTDLIAIGADVTFQKRDDRYQTYAMSLEDLGKTVGCASNTYAAPIFDEYPYIILPTMVETCTFIENTSTLPSPYPSNWQGWKIGGAILLEGETTYAYPIGTVTIPNTPTAINLSWKITGSVTYSDNLFGDLAVTNALGLFNNIADSAGGSSYCQIYFLEFPTVVGDNTEIDIVMYVDQTSLSPVVGDMEGRVSFEYEFLVEDTITPEFVF
jgi:hypothetical protein